MREPEVAAKQPAQVFEDQPDVIERSRRASGEIHRAPAKAGELTAGGVDEVVGNAAALAAGDARHRVDDVAVEAGEEAKAMFGRQVEPAALKIGISF